MIPVMRPVYNKREHENLDLGKSDVGSAYGAAGSLVIILVWCITLLKFSCSVRNSLQVYANRSGSRIVPTEIAVAVDQKPEARPK